MQYEYNPKLRKPLHAFVINSQCAKHAGGRVGMYGKLQTCAAHRMHVKKTT